MAKICNETRLLLKLAQQAVATYIREAAPLQEVPGGFDDYRRGYLRGLERYQKILDDIVKDLEDA